MSWSVSVEAMKQDAVSEIMKLEPTNEIGEGAKYQLTKAKEFACDAIAGGAIKGEKFSVSLSGGMKLGRFRCPS